MKIIFYMERMSTILPLVNFFRKSFLHQYLILFAWAFNLCKAVYCHTHSEMVKVVLTSVWLFFGGEFKILASTEFFVGSTYCYLATFYVSRTIHGSKVIFNLPLFVTKNCICLSKNILNTGECWPRAGNSAVAAARPRRLDRRNVRVLGNNWNCDGHWRGSRYRCILSVRPQVLGIL